MANHKFLLSGYYGFDNAGDDAMLFAILKLVKERFPDADVTVISGNPQKTAKDFSVRSLARFDVWRILKELKKSDVLISGGGSLLQNVTSWKSLLYYLGVILGGVMLSRKVFLFAQGIGPIRHRRVEWILKMVLRRTDAITVRDEESKRFLSRIGVTHHVYRTADAVLSLPSASPERGKQILEEHHVPSNKKLIGVSVRYWMGSNEWAHGFRRYLQALNEKGEYAFVFIPMQHPEDRKLADKICENIPHTYILKQSYETMDLMSVIGEMKLLIGVRLHALIFSALMHVPFIGISYDPKIENFLRSVRAESVFSLDAFDEKRLLKQTENILQKKESDFDWTCIDAMRKQARGTMDILEEVVKDKGAPYDGRI